MELLVLKLYQHASCSLILEKAYDMHGVCDKHFLPIPLFLCVVYVYYAWLHAV